MKAINRQNHPISRRKLRLRIEQLERRDMLAGDMDFDFASPVVDVAGNDMVVDDGAAIDTVQTGKLDPTDASPSPGFQGDTSPGAGLDGTANPFTDDSLPLVDSQQEGVDTLSPDDFDPANYDQGSGLSMDVHLQFMEDVLAEYDSQGIGSVYMDVFEAAEQADNSGPGSVDPKSTISDGGTNSLFGYTWEDGKFLGDPGTIGNADSGKIGQGKAAMDQVVDNEGGSFDNADSNEQHLGDVIAEVTGSSGSNDADSGADAGPAESETSPNSATNPTEGMTPDEIVDYNADKIADAKNPANTAGSQPGDKVPVTIYDSEGNPQEIQVVVEAPPETEKESDATGDVDPEQVNSGEVPTLWKDFADQMMAIHLAAKQGSEVNPDPGQDFATIQDPMEGIENLDDISGAGRRGVDTSVDVDVSNPDEDVIDPEKN